MTVFSSNSPSKLCLIGVPCDAGAAVAGTALGPAALRAAGLQPELERLGHQVIDRGNLSLTHTAESVVDSRYQNLAEVLEWNRLCRDQVYLSLIGGELPIVLGGDHSVSIGSVAAVARYCNERSRPLVVLWLDAHADFNTIDTSPSGNLHGMPVAVISGRGQSQLLQLGHRQPMVPVDNIYLLATRSVDPEEKTSLVRSGITVFDMRAVDELGLRAILQHILARIARDDAHLHLSFDIDSLDPDIAQGTGVKIPGGLTYREAQLCMEMLSDSGNLGSVDIMEINPILDEHGKTTELALELTSSLFGNQILPAICHPKLE